LFRVARRGARDRGLHRSRRRRVPWGVSFRIVSIEDYIDHVDGATLVYSTVTEHREHLGGEVKIGRFLAGVADVTDRSKLRGELARLGHPVAEAHLLEEFDAEQRGEPP